MGSIYGMETVYNGILHVLGREDSSANAAGVGAERTIQKEKA